MKNHLFLKSPVLILLLVFLTISCREDDRVDEAIELPDEDMIAATGLANEYLDSRGRSGGDLSVTVLKFKDGELQFGTNSDAINGYEEIQEETITATVVPGEYVFWFCGGGLSDLDGIEFDEESMLQLVDAPSEIFNGKMWALKVPDDFDEEDGILKYDIVYQYKGNSGPPIVLDPKLKVEQE